MPLHLLTTAPVCAVVSYLSFRYGHSNWALISSAFNPEALLTVFQLIDENGDGDLTLEELSKCLSEYGERMSAEELKWMVDTFGKVNAVCLSSALL